MQVMLNYCFLPFQQEYNLTNLQESSWYSCNGVNEFGDDWSSGYIWVVDEFPIDKNVLEERQEKRTIFSASVGVGVVCIVFVGFLVFVACIFKRRAKDEFKVCGGAFINSRLSRCSRARGSSSSVYLGGSDKVQACKSVLFTESFHVVKITSYKYRCGPDHLKTDI